MLRVRCSQTVTSKFICVQLHACSRPLSRTRFQSYNRKRPSRYLWPAGCRERENNVCRATFPSRPLFPVMKPAAHTADTISSRKFDLGWFHSARRILVAAWVSITSESVFISVGLDMRLVIMRRRTPRCVLFSFHCVTKVYRFLCFRPTSLTFNLLSTNMEARLVTRTKPVVLDLNVPVCRCGAKRGWKCNEAGSLTGFIHPNRYIYRNIT